MPKQRLWLPESQQVALHLYFQQPESDSQNAEFSVLFLCQYQDSMLPCHILIEHYRLLSPAQYHYSSAPFALCQWQLSLWWEITLQQVVRGFELDNDTATKQVHQCHRIQLIFLSDYLEMLRPFDVLENYLLPRVLILSQISTGELFSPLTTSLWFSVLLLWNYAFWVSSLHVNLISCCLFSVTVRTAFWASSCISRINWWILLAWVVLPDRVTIFVL